MLPISFSSSRQRSPPCGLPACRAVRGSSRDPINVNHEPFFLKLVESGHASFPERSLLSGSANFTFSDCTTTDAQRESNPPFPPSPLVPFPNNIRKTLLAETSPGARIRSAAGGKEAPARGAPPRFHHNGREDASMWIVEEAEPFPLIDGFSLHGGRPDHGPLGGGGPGDHPPHHPPPHHHNRNGPGAPWEHHPPPRHFGKEPRSGPLSGRPHHEASPGPRPSMFSVLADWLFATSDDSSSSDASSSDSSSSDSSSDDVEWFVAGVEDDSHGGGIDAGFFPAGYPRPAIPVVHEVVVGGRFPGADDKSGWGQVDDDDIPLMKAATSARLEQTSTGHTKGDPRPSVLERPPSRWSSSNKKLIKRPTKHKQPFQHKQPLGRTRINTDDDSSVMELEDMHTRLHENFSWGDKPARGHPQPQHARHPGGLPGPQHRDGGSRDHIRYRNRHPEDPNMWFADSFDSVEDLDLIETVLAMFFFIGSVTLLLLPFFLLARALKRLVRRAHGDGGGDDAPDGYQALPEDDGAQQRGRNGRGGGAVDDDDAIVVTGTPVNPPPSVHV